MAGPRFLLPGELPRIDVLRHWAALLAPGLRAGAVATPLFLLWMYATDSTLAGVLGIALVAVFGWFGWQVAHWRHERFLVTDKRVLLVTGLFTRRVGMMPLIKVTDMTYERSWLGRLLGYGAFVMESAGQEQALHRVDFIPQPEEVSQTMFTLLFGAPAGAPLPNERNPHPGPDGGADYPTDPNLPIIDVSLEP